MIAGYSKGAREARNIARMYGMDAAVQTGEVLRMRGIYSYEYMRGYTDTLLVLVQAEVS